MTQARVVLMLIKLGTKAKAKANTSFHDSSWTREYTSKTGTDFAKV